MVGAPKFINNDTKRLGTSFKCEAQKKCVDLKQELNYTTWESGINYLETVYDKMMFGFAMDANDEMFMASVHWFIWSRQCDHFYLHRRVLLKLE